MSIASTSTTATSITTTTTATTTGAATSTNSNNSILNEEHNSDNSKIVPQAPKLEATAPMCYHCFDVLVDELLGSSGNCKRRSSNSTSSSSCNRLLSFGSHHSSSTTSVTSRNNNDTLPDFVHCLPNPNSSCPLFVTWEKLRQSGTSGEDHQQFYDLRGCIGTLTPKPLLSSIGEYALTSALRDKRFQPVTWSELPTLRVAVSLLVQYEECENVDDWIIGLHGIVIRFVVPPPKSSRTNSFAGTKLFETQREYSATYLPEVASEQGWDQSTAITSLVKKAGYHGPVTSEFLSHIRCTRYQSSKIRVNFEQYMKYRGYKSNNDTKTNTNAKTTTTTATNINKNTKTNTTANPNTDKQEQQHVEGGKHNHSQQQHTVPKQQQQHAEQEQNQKQHLSTVDGPALGLLQKYHSQQQQQQQQLLQQQHHHQQQQYLKDRQNFNNKYGHHHSAAMDESPTLSPPPKWNTCNNL